MSLFSICQFSSVGKGFLGDRTDAMVYPQILAEYRHLSCSLSFSFPSLKGFQCYLTSCSSFFFLVTPALQHCKSGIFLPACGWLSAAQVDSDYIQGVCGTSFWEDLGLLVNSFCIYQSSVLVWVCVLGSAFLFDKQGIWSRGTGWCSDSGTILAARFCAQLKAYSVQITFSCILRQFPCSLIQQHKVPSGWGSCLLVLWLQSAIKSGHLFAKSGGYAACTSHTEIPVSLLVWVFVSCS